MGKRNVPSGARSRAGPLKRRAELAWAGQAEMFAREAGAFFDEVYFLGFARRDVVQQRQNEIVAPSTRNAQDRLRQAVAVGRFADERVRRQMPGVAHHQVARLAELAENRVGEIDETLALDDGRGGVGVGLRRDLEMRGKALGGPLK